MSQIANSANKFLAQYQEEEGQEVCDQKTGKCYIRSKDGLIGRELLREENVVSHSTRRYLR
jgi:hypothetical protein